MGTRKNILFRKPKTVTTGKKWYVEYYFRVPANLREEYPRDWKRFKVFEDINRVKTKQYAALLRDAVELALEDGYSPFMKESKFMKDLADETKVKIWTAGQALLFFTQKWEERGLATSSLAKYKRTQERFLAWLAAHGMQHEPVDTITRKLATTYLYDRKKALAWTNSSFNNEKTFLGTIFNFFLDQEMISKSPITGVDELRSNSKKHRFYDEDSFRKVRAIMEQYDPLLFFASKLVYYLCIRSEKELKHLRLGNIYLDRGQVLIQAAESKTKMDRMIPIPADLVPELAGLKKEYPADYYVIGVSSKTSFVAQNRPSAEPFGNGFLSKRFAKIRKLAGLSSDYTIFGMRHTRCVHLKIDGAPDQDIMNLMGHTDFATTAKYLRDLGVLSDDGRISRLSRKF